MNVKRRLSYEITCHEPLVSVIICNFNYARFLSQAIDSALAQTWKNIEIIVVDDGSTDESRDILATYDGRVKVILKDNGGQASTFNVGVLAAKGDLVCFLDSDDYWYPEKVARVVSMYRQHPWGLICHEVEEVDPLGNCINEEHHSNGALRSGDLLAATIETNYKWMFSPTSGLSLPMAIVREIFPIAEDDWRICADVPIIYGAICYAPVGVLNEPLSAYRIHHANGFAVEIKQDPLRLKVHGLVMKAKKYLFMLKHVDRAGLDVKLPNPQDDYLYYRQVCLVTMEQPVRCLHRLWSKNFRETFWRNKSLAACKTMVKFMVLDAGHVVLILFGLSSPYKSIRKYFLEYKNTVSSSVLNYFAGR